MILLNLELVEKSPKEEATVDILSPITSVGVKYPTIREGKKYTVGHDMMAKPSVLAMYAYGDSNKLDLLAYHNGFSNPFAIPSGYVLDISPLAEIKSIVDSKGLTDNKNIARELLNKKKSVMDVRRKRLLEEDMSKPNMSDTQNRNTVTGDKMILGTNSVRNNNKPPAFSFTSEDDLRQSEGFVDYFEQYLGIE